MEPYKAYLQCEIESWVSVADKRVIVYHNGKTLAETLVPAFTVKNNRLEILVLGEENNELRIEANHRNKGIRYGFGQNGLLVPKELVRRDIPMFVSSEARA